VKKKKMKNNMERFEGKESLPEEEIVTENILPELCEFMNSERFKSSVQDFCSKRVPDFEETNEGKGNQETEFTHEHKLIYDSYQQLIENLFEEFARKRRLSVQDIFSCCKDVGKYRLCYILLIFDANIYYSSGWSVCSIVSRRRKPLDRREDYGFFRF
jgi:hypothetical protein